MKSKKYKLALAILSLAILSGKGYAQDRHEFSIHGAGGLSTLHYKPSLGKQKEGFGGAVGLGYTYFFNQHWGIGTGIEAALFQAKTNISGFKDTRRILDVIENENADLTVDLKHYSEKQKMISLNVPLMLKYQSGGNHKFYAAIGGKVGFPVYDRYKISNADYDVYAYYPRTNQTLYGPMYPAGYGTYEGVDTKGDIDFKTAYFASAELGVKWKLKDGLSLYTGGYLDYGLNNINDSKKTGNVVEYTGTYDVSNASSLLRTNSVLQASKANGESFVNKVRPIAAGLKVALAFGVGKINPRQEVIVPQTRPAVDYEAERRAAAEREAAAEKARQEQLALQRERAEAEAEAAAKLKAETEYVQAKKDVAFTLHNFQLGKSAITPEIKKTLDKSISILKQYPKMKIYSTGFTCDKGTSAVNQKVSKQRAESVRAYMINAGIDASRITIQADGEKNPFVPNINEANRKLNRRVEVVAYE